MRRRQRPPRRLSCAAAAVLIRERSRRVLSIPRFPSKPDEHQSRQKRRRPLGLRLRIADVAARLPIPRTAPRATDRRPPRALRLFLRASRHAGAAGAGARPRPRRQLPWHRLSCRRRQARRNDRLSARTRAGDAGLSRNDARGLARRRSAADGAGAVLHGRPWSPPICRPARRSTEQLHFVRQGHGRSGT